MMLFIIFLTISLEGNTSTTGLNRSNKEILNSYLKIHKRFSRECSIDKEHKFEKLYHKFRSQEFFVPLVDDKLDIKTIEKYIPEIIKQRIWIVKTKNNFKKLSSRKYRKISSLVLGLKRVLIDTVKSNRDLKKRSIKKIKKEFNKLIKKIPFLLSYNFPLNHYELRSRYDSAKLLKGEKRKNDIYFYRKIVEEGAPFKGTKKSDLNLRASLDTLFLRLNSDKTTYLDEKLRYDLDEITDQLGRYLKKSKKVISRRLILWEKKIDHRLKFYKKIINSFDEGNKIALAKIKFRSNLEDFILKEQVRTYRFWYKQDTVMQAIFVIETILFNEVGFLDKYALEKVDIAQVIVNRLKTERFSTLDHLGRLYQNLFLGINSLNPDSLWLNTLLKRGEFSFTYYFIPESIRVSCPSKTRKSRFLRDKNIMIAIDKLKEKGNTFNALRYFSRASMVGRVDMASIWSDFTPLSERVGVSIRPSGRERRVFRKKRYLFLYDFLFDGKKYNVIKIGDKTLTYIRLKKRVQFFSYRNPHLFRYFISN